MRSCLVVDASNAPHAADIPIGVAPVNLPLVIQHDGNLQRLLWRVRPLQDLSLPTQHHIDSFSL